MSCVVREDKNHGKKMRLPIPLRFTKCFWGHLKPPPSLQRGNAVCLDL